LAQFSFEKLFEDKSYGQTDGQTDDQW